MQALHLVERTTVFRTSFHLAKAKRRVRRLKILQRTNEVNYTDGCCTKTTPMFFLLRFFGDDLLDRSQLSLFLCHLHIHPYFNSMSENKKRALAKETSFHYRFFHCCFGIRRR